MTAEERGTIKTDRKQTYALDRNGKLLHCGPLHMPQVGPSVIRKVIAEWEDWADRLVKDRPGVRTAESRRKTFYFGIDADDSGKTVWYYKTGQPVPVN